MNKEKASESSAQNPMTDPMADRFMTTQEVMKFLNLSRTKVWELIKTESFPAFKIGNDYRFRLSEVLAWMENKRVERQ